MDMTGLDLGDPFFKRADGLAMGVGGNRRYRGLKRTGFLDALGPHVFEKLRPDLCLLNQIENDLSLGLVDRSSVSVVIIPDDHDVEDVAGDIAPEKGIGAADGL